MLAWTVAVQPCRAAPLTVALDPATARIGVTVFVAGLWPSRGQFDRFKGHLTLDPSAPGHCLVDVRVDVASLRMSGLGQTRIALGPSLLDAPRFASLDYTGTCGAETVTGPLTLHGVTRPLVLTWHRAGDSVEATGSLERQDFGVSGLLGLIGRRVEFHVAITLPPGLFPGK